MYPKKEIPMRACSLVSLLLAFTASIVFGADILHMKDGSKREGTIKNEKADVVVFETRQGSLKATVEVDRKDIAKIETRNGPDKPEERKYKLLLQEVEFVSGNPADLLAAWKRVAEFCEKTPGYETGAREAHSRIAALEPSHQGQYRKNSESAAISNNIYNENLKPEERYSVVTLSKTPYVITDRYKPLEPFPSTDAGYAEFAARSAAARAGVAYDPNAPATTTTQQQYTDAAGYGRTYGGSYGGSNGYGNSGQQSRSSYVLNLPNSYSNGYSTGITYWNSRESIVSPFAYHNSRLTNYAQAYAGSTNQTVGSFQDARNSYVQVPNSYFGVSTGNYDTRTRRWVGPQPQQ
jgi:hypothetical protein